MANSNDKPWQVLATRTLLENPWFAIRGREVQLPSGRVIDFQSIDFPRPAVAVVAQREGQILLIRQYRLTIDSEVWALPSGGVDAGESSEAAARRELIEETGLEATSMRPLIAYNPSYGASNQLFEVFLAEDPRDTPEPFDRDEVLETRWFDRAEVVRMLFANEIVDGLSATPLALLFLEDALGAQGNGPRLKGTLPSGPQS